MEDEIVTVRPETLTASRQNIPMLLGITATTAGTRGLSLYKVVIPPGGSAEPHMHRNYETAIYVLKGEIETRYGAGLAKSVVHRAGDFLFIPPGLPHQPINLSPTETAEAIVARNDPSEQENVVPYREG